MSRDKDKNSESKHYDSGYSAGRESANSDKDDSLTGRASSDAGILSNPNGWKNPWDEENEDTEDE